LYSNGQVNLKAKFDKNEIDEFQAYYRDGSLKFEGNGNGKDYIENLKFYTEKGIPREYRRMTMMAIMHRIGLTGTALCYTFVLEQN